MALIAPACFHFLFISLGSFILPSLYLFIFFSQWTQHTYAIHYRSLFIYQLGQSSGASLRVHPTSQVVVSLQLPFINNPAGIPYPVKERKKSNYLQTAVN